jgi:hypothetical protein
MAVQTGGAAAEHAMDVVANLCNVALALGGIGLLIWFVVFLATPRERKQVLATTSAQYAAEVGGTRTLRMGA